MPEAQPTTAGGQGKNAGSAINAEPARKAQKGISQLEFKNELSAPASQPSPKDKPEQEQPNNKNEERNGDQGYSEQEGSETLGEQEHEMALKRQLDQQKKIDADFKAEQEASAEPEKLKAPEKEKKEEAVEEKEEEEPDKPYTPPPGTPPEGADTEKKPEQPDGKSQAEKEDDWARKGMLERANLMKKAATEKDAQKQKQAADQIPDPAQAGPEETLKRVFKGKCFSCTGCLGIIHRFILDFNGASMIYAFLDMLWTDDNTDKCFSCSCCCNVLAMILTILSPILIGIGLALLAAKALGSVIDIDTIMSFF